MRIIVKKVRHEESRSSVRRGGKTAALAAAAVALLAVRFAAGCSALPSAASLGWQQSSAVTYERSEGEIHGESGADETVPDVTASTTGATTTTLPQSGGNATSAVRENETTVTEAEADPDDMLSEGEEIDSGVKAGYGGKLDIPSNVSLDRLDFGSDFVKPLRRGRITSRFDYRVNPVTGRYVFHTGMDLGAASGSDIMAMKSGRVISAKTNGGYGKVVIIEHENGVRTLYAHCSRLLVRAGERVRKGQVIALVGSTGNSTGPHLHIEFRKGGKRYDPEWVIGGIYN